MRRFSFVRAPLRAAAAAVCGVLVIGLAPAPAAAQFVCNSTTPGGADGAEATGNFSVVCGTQAGHFSNGRSNSAFGTAAGGFVNGNFNSAFGVGAGNTTIGDSNAAFGRAAGSFVTGHDNVAIGSEAGSPDGGIAFSYTVAIGNRALARSEGGVTVGDRSLTDGTHAVAMGAFNTVIGDSSGAFGTGNTVIGDSSFVLGHNNNNNTATLTAGWGDNVNVVGSRNIIANTASASGSTVLGNDNTVNASNALVVGNGATVTGGNAVAIGNGVHVAGVNGIAVGKLASADYANSAAFGAGATATRDNQQVFGTTSNTYTMSGIASSASRAAQSGPVRVVTSDAGGNLATASLSDLGFASTGDIGAINARLNELTKETRRGIAAATALATAMTPSAPGKTTVSVNSGFFKGETGVGAAVAHRLNFSTPVIVHGSYANSGGNGHVGRVGVGFEF